MKQSKKLSDLTKKCGTIGKAFDECAEYASIGTVEECREAVEMRTAKKPIDRIAFKECPTCGHVDIGSYGFCERCGQRLDWSDDDENTD